MATLARREGSSPLAELFDWLEEGFPSMSALRAGTSRMRIEDYEEDGRYIVRAEMPDIDPEKDVEITVKDGVLTVKAERREEKKDKQRSEFHYGSFERRMTLPLGATEEDVHATYENGILTVSVPLKAPEPEKETRHVPVMRKTGG